MEFSSIYIEVCAAVARKKQEDKEEQVSIAVSRYKELLEKARKWDIMQSSVVIPKRNYDTVFKSIHEEVCAYYHADKEVLLSRKRYKIYVDVKRTFMYVCTALGMGVSEIGRYLGIDHTTVIHHRDNNKNLLETEEEYAAEMYNLLNSIKHKLFNDNNNINEV